MEAGPVQYAVTTDGVSIAYRRFGTGPPLIMPPGGLADTMAVTAELGMLAVSSAHSTVRYDRRGTGLSDRDVVGFTPEGASADLDAVVAAVSDESVPLVGLGMYGPAVLRYAVEHRDRVSHLVLPLTFPSLRVLLTTPAFQAQKAALEADFEFWLYATTGWNTRGKRETASIVEILREDLDREGTLASFADMELHDASDVLGAITAPTLVVLRSVYGTNSIPDMRRLPAEIGNAQVVIDDSTDPYTLSSDTDRAVVRFLGVIDASQAGSSSQTIMFTDLVSSTSLTQQLGDRGAQEILDGHDQAVRAALLAHRGREIKHTGDGIMAVFGSALDAATAAKRIQRDLSGARIATRVGLNSGEPVEQDGDLFGTAVQLAARLCDHAPAGEICAAAVVKDLTAGSDLRWVKQEPFTPKGYSEPIESYTLTPEP